MGDFKLSASLEGHGDDVRGVAFPEPGVILSASRDATVRVWKLISPAPPKFDDILSSHGSSFINALTYLPPNTQYPEGLIISGGKDPIIEVRQPSKPPEDNAEALLLGHSHNICALDVDPSGRWIVSGSWDGSARLWGVGKWECEEVLEGHEGSVWAVMFWDPKTIVTGCADKLIRVFSTDGKLLRTIRGNTQVVRAVCRVPSNHPSGAQFASASNDGVIRLWTLDGQERGQLRGHDSFIYSLASLPTGELVSSGEDRTVKIWKGWDCLQTITHPAISVWCVAACTASGDIVSGASDRIVRVFTRDSSRQADAAAIQVFEESVKSSAIPQQQLGEINKEKLPGPEFLQQKSGTKEGQVVMIREANGNVTAHQWSTATRQWISVGTVVDAVGSSGRKQDYLGQDYDYVFDVDIKEGAPPLKLPYNLSQNPYEAATKFLQDNELPIGYLDQVANFIVTNTRGATIGQSQAGDTPQQQQQQQPSGPDPFGIESRYRPGDASSTYAPEPGAAAAAAAARPKKLPQASYLSLKQANLKTIQKKIEELNRELIAGGSKDVSLNPSDLALLQELTGVLEPALTAPTAPATPTKAAVAAAANAIPLVVRLVTLWPPAQRLPGLDLLRLVAAGAGSALASYTGPADETVVDILDRSGVFADAERPNNILLAVRVFVNLFESPEGRALVESHFDKILSLTSVCASLSSNRNVLIAYVTLFINFSVLLTSPPASSSSAATSTSTSTPSSSSSSPSPVERALTLLETFAPIVGAASDSEVTYRALVAAGTLLAVLGADVQSAARDIFDFPAKLRAIRAKAVEPRIKDIVGEIEALLPK